MARRYRIRRCPSRSSSQPRWTSTASFVEADRDLGCAADPPRKHRGPKEEHDADDRHRPGLTQTREHRDGEERRGQTRQVVGDVVHGEHPSPIPVGDGFLHERVHGDLLPREGEPDGERRQQDAPCGDRRRDREEHQATQEEGAGHDPLLGEALLELADREDPDEDAHATRADQVGERRHPFLEPVAEHEERQHEDDPLSHLIERDRDDRPERSRRPEEAARPVGELVDDPPQLVPNRRLRKTVRDERRRDPGGDRRRGDPLRPRETDHDRIVGEVGHPTPDEHAGEQGDRAADDRDRVRDQEVLGRDQTRHDGDRGREVEAVHREHPQRAEIEGDGRRLRIEQRETDEGRTEHRSDHEDPAP
jgi:hypothetical protein